MSDTLLQEDKIIDTIVQRLIKLGNEVDTMETTDNHLEAYKAQEKAISEIRQTIRDTERLDWVGADEDDEFDTKMDYDEGHIGKTLVQIDYTLQKLDRALAVLEKDDNSKVKAWYEQRKALHEVKRILHLIDKNIGYDEDELSMLTPE